MMRSIALAALAGWTLFLTSAAAQRTYTFEEACRNAGMTTGPCAPKAEREKSIGCVRLGGSAFHAEKAVGSCIQTTLAPGDDAQIFVELVGLPNIPKVNELKLTIGRSSGFKNAVALFHSGSRMIIHDPQWARTDTAEFYLVLGHEAGHHFCRHVLEQDPTSMKSLELEADRFSGASIKRFEAYHGKSFLNDALAAAALLYSEAGSRSHPPRAARLEAIKLGYASGSPCGNLTDGIRGFAPKQR